MKKRIIDVCIMIAVLLVSIMAIVSIISRGNEENISYSEVVSMIEKNDVTEIILSEDNNTAKVQTKDEKLYRMQIPSREAFLEFITEKVKEGNTVKLEVQEIKESSEISKIFLNGIATIIITVCQIGAMMICFIFIFRKINDSGSKNKNHEILDKLDIFGSSNFVKEASSNIRFSDVAGIDEEKQQLQEIVSFLKNGEEYNKIGAKVPKGILLTGMPGTGKTLLAKAIAGEAGVPFFQANGAEFEEKFVGVGAGRVRALFYQARKKAPCIIFIDEIDAVAGKRYGKNQNYSEQTLNMLLSEMDGFEETEGIVVIAATNHEEVLDEAILRPGRFDRKIYIPLPDEHARLEILKVHSKDKIISNNVNLIEEAKKTIGFSGAELKNFLNEAAILAVNRGVKEIETCDLDEAYVRIAIGLEKRNRPISKKEKYQTAIHESGHAIVSFVMCPNTEIMGISIIPRGKAGGYNLFNEEEKLYLTREDVIAKIIVAYGGKAAEEVILGIISSGPSSDLKNATQIAYDVVTKYAMSDKLVVQTGNESFDKYLMQTRFAEVEDICSRAYETAKAIVEKNKHMLCKLAIELIDKESLSADEIKDFLSSDVIF